MSSTTNVGSCLCREFVHIPNVWVGSDWGHESGGLDVVGDGGLEGSECLADCAFRGWFVGVEEGSEESVSELGVEHGDADPVGGEDVGVL